ncbi:MAG TPA: Ku protein [Tepidiformaceae bacterium]|nr:Ku protein [Tepidiformaceae bacterium]
MAARAIWRGTISFGMVSIPVKLFTATDSQDISFKQLHAADNSPIRLVRRCAADGEDLTPDEIVKGYEYSKDRYVIVTDADLDHIPLPSKQQIELTAFVHGSEIDPLFFEKGYYVEPEEVGRKPFALLVRALTERKLLAVGKLAIRTKERLCALRPHDGSLVLETLFYADEVRTPEAAPPAVAVSEAEMKIANALIDLLEEPFDPTKYTDEYRVAMMAVITAKLEGQEYVAAPAPEAAAPAVDLMAALRASVEAAQGRKAASGSAPEAAPASTNGRQKKAARPEAEESEAEPVAAKGGSRRKKTSTPA